MASTILMPRQGQSVESCILVEWKVKAGDAVQQGTIVASIETDKAVFDVESTADGTVLELFFEEGADVPVLTPIAAVGQPGEDASALRPQDGDAPAAAPAAPAAAASEAKPAEAQPATKPQAAAPAAAAQPVAAAPSGKASPRARRRADREGVTVSALQGSGPEGRVIERDVVAAAAQGGRLSPVAKAALAATGGRRPLHGTGPGGMVQSGDLLAAQAAAEPETIPVRGIRKIIAERMKASLDTTAQLTMHRSIDATSMLAYRAKLKEHGEWFGLSSLTINDLIVYAVVQTLRRHPDLNAHFLGDRIVRYPQVNVGVAVDTPRGLMVPVVRGAEQMSPAELANEIRPLAKACQEGAVDPDRLTGGTFTVTNLGVLGVEAFTPVLNAPEVGILGVGGLNLKPVQKGAEVVHVQAMTLSLTIDHQAVDGAPGARFLQGLAMALENVELLLSEGSTHGTV